MPPAGAVAVVSGRSVISAPVVRIIPAMLAAFAVADALSPAGGAAACAASCAANWVLSAAWSPAAEQGRSHPGGDADREGDHDLPPNGAAEHPVQRGFEEESAFAQPRRQQPQGPGVHSGAVQEQSKGDRQDKKEIGDQLDQAGEGRQRTAEQQTPRSGQVAGDLVTQAGDAQGQALLLEETVNLGLGITLRAEQRRQGGGQPLHLCGQRADRIR